MKKLLIIVSHPVPYHVPIYRLLNERGNVELEVFFLWNCFESEETEAEGTSQSFWPFVHEKEVLKGYSSKFIKNIAIKKYNSPFGLINPGLFRSIKESNPDMIMIFGYNTVSSWITAISSMIFRIPLLFKGETYWTSQSNSESQFIKKLYISLYLSFVSFYAYAFEKNREFYKSFGAKDSSLFFVPCAVDSKRLEAKSIEDLEKYKQLLDLKEDEKVIIYVGRFSERKSPLHLLEAFTIAFKKEPRLRLFFIGEGRLKDDIERYIRENDLAKNVSIIGFLNEDQIIPYYQLSDLLVLPSEMDPSPKVINEAFTFSTPTIVSDQIGTAGDLVVNNVNGMIYKWGDIDSLANKILHVLNDENYHSFSREALKTIDKWSIENGVKSIEKCLEEET